MFEKCLIRASPHIEKKIWNEDDQRIKVIQERNGNYAPPPGVLVRIIKVALDSLDIASGARIEAQFLKSCKEWNITEDDLYEYLGEEKFVPHVFLNISPNWKGHGDVLALDRLIDAYMRESNRFEKWTYIIENGSDGDMIHAHIVAKINAKYEKSVITHLNKGNHVQQLKKYAKGDKGIEGCVSGQGVQRTILRNPELIKDKLDYLIETLKPEGHKNKSIIWESPKTVSIFTVK